MCYVQGSIDQATAVCPMCKVYKPTGARCPHIRETCTNRANHPRGNVVYLKNPEVPTFKGCGYCKWANANPPSKAAGYNNAGWPGCCRPPREDDKRLISAADWLAVSLVHHVNIPADVRAALEGAGVKVPTIKVAASQGSPKGTSATITPTKPNASPRTTPIAIPTKARAGTASPQQVSSSLTPVRETSKAGIHSSPKTVAAADDHPAREPSKLSSPRLISADATLSRRAEHSSPNRRHADLEGGSVSRRGSVQRTSVTALAAAMSGAAIADDKRPSLARRASTAGTGTGTGSGSGARQRAAPSPPRSGESGASAPQSTPTSNRQRRQSTSLEDMPTPVLAPVKTSVPAAKSLNSASSSASTSSGGSLSDNNTITSEGFTDYLSDESDAEIQRQAELKAALLAQNHAEEVEFNLARKQLQRVNLQPPKSWNSTVRSNAPAHAPLSAYNYNAPKQYSGYAV